MATPHVLSHDNDTLPEWRVTRPDVYTADCPGRTDPRARQGYYIYALTPDAAIQTMRQMFPVDSRFDIERWK